MVAMEQTKLQGGLGNVVTVMLKRLAVWLLETVCVALLLSLLLIVLAWAEETGPYISSRGFAHDMLVALAMTAIFVVNTGYLLTTAVCRVVWWNQRLWSYPVAAAVLFLAHLQYLFFETNGETSSERLRLRAAGVCIVLGCTLVGSCLLRKWAEGGSKKADAKAN